MKEIKLTIQKNEDIVFLMQGLNWIRMHNTKELVKELEINEHLDKKKEKPIFKTLNERSEIHDRIMTLLAQLDNILENGVKCKA